MPDSAVTLRHVFAVPEPTGEKESPETWQKFRTRLTDEIKGIKIGPMPDIAAKVGELLDIPVPSILLASWTKADALKSLLEESRRNPEAIMDLELADHTIDSQHHPYIEVRIHNATVKKIEFTLRLAFNLKGCVLRVQDGVIKEMRAGACDVQGLMAYGGVTILEKTTAPIYFPGPIFFDRTAD